MSNGKFALDISAWVTKVKVDINAKVIAVASELFREIYKETPITTGHLRYNWLVSLDNPKSGTRGERPFKYMDTDARMKLISANPAEQALTEGLEIIKSFDYKRNKSIWISNNVDYAYQIEYIGAFDGEMSAPAAMVRTSMQKIQGKLNTL